MSDSSSNTEKVQDGIAVKETRKKTTVCQFYARGQWCRFGSRCRFLHQRQPKPKTSKIKPIRNLPTEQHHEGLNELENLDLVAEEPSGANGAPVTSSDNSKPICKFFVKHRFCGYGDNCRYSHEVPVKKNTSTADSSQETPVEVGSSINQDGSKEERTRPYRNAAGRRPRKPLCRYFKRGGCAQGDRCKFYHPVKDILDDVTDNLNNVELSGKLEHGVGGTTGEATAPPAGDAKPRAQGYQHRRTPIYNRSGGPQFQFRLDDLKAEDLENLRQREINQLKRRYPQALAFEDEKGREAFTVTFVPTDPDWPYDVKHLKMTIIFAEDYPAKRLQVKLPEDDAVPDTVKRQVWFGMQDWLRSRFDRLAENGIVELVFKPLLRLLDRSLEDLFTEGLKLYKKELMALASGIQLVSASVLNDKFNQSSDEEEEEEEEDKDEDGDYFEEEEYDSGTEDGASDDEEEEEEAEYNVDHRTLDPAKRGIEVKLQQLQLKEQASTLRIYFAKFILQCGRCKNNAEIKLATSSATVIICNKCHEEQIVQLRPGIAHQFTSVIGYLDAENCSPVDLILTDCLFMIGCLECSKESKVEGLPHGQLKTIFCSCHKKLQLAVESTRFTQLKPSDYVDIRGAVVVKANKRSTRDPAIQEGRPLPNTGTCKHYKKSFRWLRFPCCGKAYPCDECHDEKEDHEMQFANRMICGFCAKEQSFAANRDCIKCGSNMTKKSGAHWEGGKGCRDVVKMSRGDKKKYANSNKTVSKKSQAKPKSGKKTKLRHV